MAVLALWGRWVDDNMWPRAGTVFALLDICALTITISLAFAVSLGEFGATSFLARDAAPTMPVVIYRLIGRPGAENYGMALAAAVVLAVATTLVMLAVECLRVPSLGAW